MGSHWLEVSAKAAVIVFVGLAIRFLTRNNRPPGSADSSSDNEEKDVDDVSSSSDATDPGQEFEVFLSFRGTDTRKTFTDYLYHDLVGAGVRTFRDDEELPVGEEIGPDLMRAITQSKISIPIFSKGYASSKWCLRELAEIVRCMKDTGGKHKIMPIFFDVTPDEVQHQTGAYAKSFSKHKRRYSSETVREWRNALAEVTKLKGLELEKAASGNQGQFIKVVVVSILRELKKACLNEGEIQVGIDSSAEEVIQLLKDSAKDRKMVVMWGIGGIGKTTLAKHVYNRILDDFESQSFLADIREKSKYPSGLPRLQSKLVSDILGHGNYDFAGIDEGINELKIRLRGKKSLILLDDVDHIDQLKALAGDLSWFGSGSRIMVTTRDKEVLGRFKECISIYEVQPLDKDQSIELFYKHVFRNELPGIEFIELSREIVGTTGGLPLALEVIGSFLFAHREKEGVWRDTLKRLITQPHDDVQGKLKISYDALTDEQKKIFLDIACFFIGWHYETLALMWDDCKFYPTLGIEVLQLKSLIKVTDNGKLQMHDQLRDLGRHIVEQENKEEPGCRSRLWHETEATDVLLKQQGTSKVEAAFIIGSEEEVVFDSKCFTNLRHLRILQLPYGVVLSGNFQQLLPNLRWLRWIAPELSRRLENVQLDNLVYLDLSNSSVGDEWSGWRSIKMARLKVLDLRFCNELRETPPFSAFPSLERLILNGCSSLVRIDPSVKLLKKLNYLDLLECDKLESLPNEMAQLEALIELEAYRTGIKEISIISQSSIKMGRLKVLDLSECWQLREISSFSAFPNLERLVLKGCTNLVSVDGSIGLLKNLKYLSLEECYKLENLPDQFADLESLVELNVSYSGVKTIPLSPRMKKLETLDANSCFNLERLPDDVCTLSHLQTLDLEKCEDLHNLPELPRSLINLKVGAHSVGCWGNLEGLVNLKEVQLLGDYVRRKPQQNLDYPAMGAKFRQLEILVLRNVEFCYVPEGIVSSPRMKEIEIFSFKRLQSLPLLSSNLLSLSVGECPLLERLPNLSNLRKLSKLYIRECPMLREIEGLSELTALESLVIGGDDGIEALPAGLSNLQMLRELKLDGNRKLVDIQGIDSLSRLVQLTLRDCPAVEHLPLSKLQKLEKLELYGCEKLRALEGLQDLISLRQLFIGDCDAIEEPLPLPPSLVTLLVKDCEKLPDVYDSPYSLQSPSDTEEEITDSDDTEEEITDSDDPEEEITDSDLDLDFERDLS